jgi:hypothetical protein
MPHQFSLPGLGTGSHLRSQYLLDEFDLATYPAGHVGYITALCLDSTRNSQGPTVYQDFSHDGLL